MSPVTNDSASWQRGRKFNLGQIRFSVVLQMGCAEFAHFNWFWIRSKSCFINIISLRKDTAAVIWFIKPTLDHVDEAAYCRPRCVFMCLCVYVCVWWAWRRCDLCPECLRLHLCCDIQSLWYGKLGFVGLEEEKLIPTEDRYQLSDEPHWYHHVVAALPTCFLLQLVMTLTPHAAFKSTWILLFLWCIWRSGGLLFVLISSY